MNWNKVFPIPTPWQIARHQNPGNCRSPYIAGWLAIPQKTRYTEYAVELKADHLPDGTYCCLGNWTMDYSALEQKYRSYRTEYQGVHGYAGFQSTDAGSRVSILSFWDIFCTDYFGNQTVIRAKRVCPARSDGNDSFGGEGTGAHCLVPYQWKAGQWYRMYLRCVPSPITGNTVVEQWVLDLQTGAGTLLCAYDLGVEDACFLGPTAIFLENFDPALAAQVRTMEVRNPKYRDADTKRWYSIPSVGMHCEGGLPKYEGSYRFGVSGDRIWMITSGVGGDWYGDGRGQQPGHFTIRKD